jgi:hypothetical protein
VKRCKEIVVTKRDGSAECFNVAKLSTCLARALQGAAYDPRLARPLSRAVALHLGEWSDSRPPTTNYVFRCVCSVLQQTGLGDVAQSLHHARRLRDNHRRRVRVFDSDQQRDRRHGRAWQKVSLVASLQERYGLRHAVSRFIAGQVESQVFALKYRAITKPFLSELVHNEVLAWGLADLPASNTGIASQAEQPVGPRQPDEED